MGLPRTRLHLWLLGDLAESIGQRPSHLIEMPQAGYTPAECLDFDLAVRALMRWAKGREQQTKLVNAPERTSKTPQQAVPVYKTLAEVLALSDDERDEALRLSGLSDDDVAEIADDWLDYDGEDE